MIKIGGSTCMIEEDSLVEAIEKLRKAMNDVESIPMHLDSISIFVKTKKKYEGIGNDGIEMDVGTNYIKKPKKKVVIYYHLHT